MPRRSGGSYQRDKLGGHKGRKRASEKQKLFVKGSQGLKPVVKKRKRAAKKRS